MRAIQQKEFGGPEVLELVELPVPEAGERRGPHQGLARGNELRRHPPAPQRLPRGPAAAARAGRRGGRRARGHRAARGGPERHRRLRRVRDGARGADLPDPRRRRRRHRAGAAHPGPDRVAPVPHVGARRARRVGGDRRRGRRRRLARRPAGQADGGRARDRDGLDAGQARPRARAGRRRRDRLGPRGPEGPPRSRPTGAARSTSSSRWPAARSSTPASPRWRRSAAW